MAACLRPLGWAYLPLLLVVLVVFPAPADDLADFREALVDKDDSEARKKARSLVFEAACVECQSHAACVCHTMSVPPLHCSTCDACETCQDRIDALIRRERPFVRRERRWRRLQRSIRRAIEAGDGELAEELLLERRELLREEAARDRLLTRWEKRASEVEALRVDSPSGAQRTLDRAEFPKARWNYGSEVFTNRVALSGFGSVIDARFSAPLWEGSASERIAIRGGVRLGVEVEELEFRTSGTSDRKSDRYNAGVFVGLSLDTALTPIELGLHYRGYERVDLDHRGISDPRDRLEGGGDLELGLKLPIPLDSFGLSRGVSAAIYAAGRVELGSETEQSSSAEHGFAISFFPAGDMLQLHVNAGAYFEERGVLAFRYRFMSSFARELTGHGDAVVRFNVGLEGLEFEGRPTSNVDLIGGVQALLWQHLTLELGASLQLVNSGFRRRPLERELGRLQIRERHSDDRAYGMFVSVGLAF